MPLSPPHLDGYRLAAMSSDAAAMASKSSLLSAAQHYHPNSSSHPLPLKRQYRILDIPPDALDHLFHQLSAEPHTAGSHARPAHALASTCKIFNTYYRERYVTALQFNQAAPEAAIGLCLARFPRATVLTVATHAGDGSPHTPTARFDLRTALPPKGSTIGHKVTKVFLKNLGLVAEERLGGSWGLSPLRGLAEAFPNLKELSLHLTDPLLTGDLYVSVFRPLSQTLECLDVSGDPDVPRFRSGLSDHFGEALLVMARLTHLNISGCMQMGGSTFDALAKMPLLRVLEMRGTSVTNRRLVKLLGRLSQLHVLDVSSCENLCPEILPYVPPNIQTLKLSFTSLLGDDNIPIPPHFTPGDHLGPNHTGRRRKGNPSSLSSVHVLHARLLETPMQSWRVLYGMYALEELRLDGKANNNFGVPSVFAAQALADMQNLRVLDIGWSLCGDETAPAIACLPKLEELGLFDTYLSDEGVATIAHGVCRLSLVFVDFRRLNRVVRPAETMALMEAALKPNAKVEW